MSKICGHGGSSYLGRSMINQARDFVSSLDAHVTQGGLYYRVLGIKTRGEDRVKLASSPGFPFRILSRSFGEKSEGKPGRISYVIRWQHITRNILLVVYCQGPEGKKIRESKPSPR